MSWQERYGDEGAIQAYADNFGLELEDVNESDFLDAFRGEYADIEDYARELVDSMGVLEPGSLAEQYFDYESFANDLEQGGDIWTADAPGYRVYVFDNL